MERMLDVPQIDDMRRPWPEGCCTSEMARGTGHDGKTVGKLLDEVDFSPEPPAGVVPGPSKLDPHKPTTDSMLEADGHVWGKRRHTARKILAELRRAGYDGGHTLAQKCVHDRELEMRGRAPEGFLDLGWSPGAARAGFGEADFDTADGRGRMPFLVVSFPHSGMPWFRVFRGRASECVRQGPADVFRHMGGPSRRRARQRDRGGAPGPRRGEGGRALPQAQAPPRLRGEVPRPRRGAREGSRRAQGRLRAPRRVRPRPPRRRPAGARRVPPRGGRRLR